MARYCRRTGPRFCREHEDLFFEVTQELTQDERSMLWGGWWTAAQNNFADYLTAISAVAY
jgi:hypothetical protein